MTSIDELREQFNFLKRQTDENKKEYKARIKKRGQELFDKGKEVKRSIGLISKDDIEILIGE